MNDLNSLGFPGINFTYPKYLALQWTRWARSKNAVATVSVRKFENLARLRKLLSSEIWINTTENENLYRQNYNLVRNTICKSMNCCLLLQWVERAFQNDCRWNQKSSRCSFLRKSQQISTTSLASMAKHGGRLRVIKSRFPYLPRIIRRSVFDRRLAASEWRHISEIANTVEPSLSPRLNDAQLLFLFALWNQKSVIRLYLRMNCCVISVISVFPLLITDYTAHWRVRVHIAPVTSSTYLTWQNK